MCACWKREAERAVQMSGKIKAISISPQKGMKKKNVKNAVFRKSQGILKDAHAGKGKRQVSLLAHESIKKMHERGVRVAPGGFGENITTEGIDLAPLKIGGMLLLGKKVILKVTMKGKKCIKPCSIFYRAGVCIMPKEGVFARVIRGGRVSPGDTIEEK